MASSVIGYLRVNLGLDSAAFQSGLQSAQKSLKGVGASMRSAGQSLSLGLSTPLVGFGGLIVKTAGDFEASMNRVKAATGAPADQLQALSDKAKELGRTTQFSASEAADAIETLAKNGLTASQILDGALSASLQLAAASGTDLASAGDIATDVMLQFNKQASDLDGVVDGITGVLLASKFGIDDYRLALAQAGGVAGGVGVEFDDFNAAIAGTSSLFASGSDAGTSFKTFLQRLVPQTDGAAAAMQELGLEFFNADGSMRSIAEISQELKEGLSGLSEEARTANLTEIFGTDAMRTAIGLANQGAEGIDRLSASIAKASAADQAAARMEGFNGAMKELSSAFEALQIAIAESGVLEFVTGFAIKLTDLVSGLSQTNPELLKWGTVIAGLGVALGPVLIAVGVLATAAAAISAPVLAAVAAIAAITAGVIAFWPEVVKTKDSLAQLVTDGIAAVQAGLADFGNSLVSAKDGMVQFATDGVEWVKTKFQELLDFVRGLPEQFAQVGRDIADGLIGGLQAKWQSVKDSISGLGTSMAGWFRESVDSHSPSRVFAAIGGDVMDGLKLGLDSNKDGIQSGMDSFASSLAGRMQGVLTGAVKFKDALKQTLASAVSGYASNLFNSGISGLFGALKIPGFANGTNDHPGGWSWGNERGGELMYLPSGTTVIPNDISKRMADGGGSAGVSFTQNINLSAMGDQSVRQIIRAETPRIAEQAKAAVLDARRRGGSFGGAF